MSLFKTIKEVIFLISPDTRSVQDCSLCEACHGLIFYNFFTNRLSNF